MLTNKYKTKLKGFKGISGSDIPKMHEEIELVNDSNKLLLDLFNEIMEKDQSYGIRWLMGFERYIKVHSKSISKIFRKNLSRGHIVQVELFGHFNRELTFLHPAVVLYDNNKGQLLVAPISTSKYRDTDPLHIDVDSFDGLDHESGICLEAIRGIDKHRVLYQHEKDGKKAKVRSEILDKIDLAIMENFLPNTFKNFEYMKVKLIEEQKRTLELEDENKLLKEQLRQFAYHKTAAAKEK